MKTGDIVRFIEVKHYWGVGVEEAEDGTLSIEYVPYRDKSPDTSYDIDWVRGERWRVVRMVGLGKDYPVCMCVPLSHPEWDQIGFYEDEIELVQHRAII